jgi:hypothetical protein
MQPPKQLQKVDVNEGLANADNSGVALSDLVTTIIENYGSAAQNGAQLKALQDWVRGQQKIQ